MEADVVCVIDYLLSNYAVAKAEALKTDPMVEGAKLKADDSLMDFRKFCIEHLTKTRAALITHAEANFIIQMTNGRRFAICPQSPDQAVPGTMQPSAFIAVTGSETAREMARNATGMRGDMTLISRGEDKSLGGPEIRFDR